MKIFPIKGKETRRVFVSYMEPLIQEDGYYRYRYPLSVPGGAPAVEQFQITADIDMPQGVDALATPLYQTEVQVAENKAQVEFSAERYKPAADFVLQFASRDQSGALRIATQTDPGGDTYAMALVEPDIGPRKPAGGARVVFVLDKSYSVAPEILTLAGATVLELISGLGRDDAFALLACDDRCSALFDGLDFPNLEVLKRAHAFLKGIEPSGSSNLLGALDAAFSLVRDGEPATVVYLGDAVPTSGAIDPSELIGLVEKIKPGAVALHAVGLGPNLDRVILDGLAARLGGSSYVLSIGESPVVAAGALTKRIYQSGLLDAEILWPEGVESAGPAQLGAVPAGAEIASYARLTKAELSGDLILRGRLPDGQTYERTYPISLKAGEPGPGFIDRLWARSRLDRLTLDRADPKTIIALSRSARVASRLTSWIVLENQRMYDEFNIQRTEPEAGIGAPAGFVSVESQEDADEASARESVQRENQEDRLDSKRTAATGAAGAPAASPAGPSDSVIGSEPGPPRQEVSIDPPAPPSYKSVKRIREYANALREAPLSRENNRRYVRLLARSGRTEDARKAAETWYQSDPLGAGAIITLADQIARTGDRQRALGLYTSVAEVDPGSSRVHLRLAETFRNLGDYRAAAGHYRAAAAGTRADPAIWLDYLVALANGGSRALFDLEAERLAGDRRLRKMQARIAEIRGAVEAGLEPEMPKQSVRGALLVKLSVGNAPVDLDLAILDPYGRRISGLWPQGASSDGLSSKQGETLAVHGLLSGVYHLFVTRPVPGSADPISGELQIEVKGLSQTASFKLTGPEVEVATVRIK